LLGGLGFGVAPDVRIVAPPISAKADYILFRLPPDGDCPVSDAYLSAEIVIQAVAAAWQTVPGKDLGRIVERSNAIAPLEPTDTIRLRAFQKVVAAPGVKLNGLKRRIDQVTYPPERERIVDAIVAILTADGAVAPSEVAVLTKVFQLFGLDSVEVTAKLHGQLTAGPARRASRSATLDPELVRHKQRETDRVGALLGTIFAEEETPAPVPVVRGLDAAHAQLVQDLRAKPSWSRAEFSRLAAKHRLLPDGAIDTLNEAALDTVGEYLFDNDDPLVLNDAVLKELLS
jgi:tellurite resistance protein